MKTSQYRRRLFLERLEKRRLLATINWTGAGNPDDWGVGGNWQNGQTPGQFDTALFDNTASSTLPGEVTSFSTVDRTIGGLSYQSTAGNFHATDLGGKTLTVTGNLNFNLNQDGNPTTVIRNGRLVVDGSFANVNVGKSLTTRARGTADLSGLNELQADVNQFHIGIDSQGFGELTLPALSQITAKEVVVGDSGVGLLHLGDNTSIVARDFVVAKDHSHGTVDIDRGSDFSLGSVGDPTQLSIGDQDTNTLSALTGRVDLTGADSFNAELDGLVVGRKFGGPGTARGELIGADSGTIRIGSANDADIIIGQSVTGGSVASIVDLSSQDTLDASVDQFLIADAVTGFADADVKLAKNNIIDASSFVVGRTNSVADLRLGSQNTIVADEWLIAEDFSISTVTIDSRGELDLGTTDRPTLLSIADQMHNTNSKRTGLLDLTGADRFDAVLDGLLVGRKLGGPGTTVGEFFGAAAGKVQIGMPGNEADLVVGHNVNGGSVSGLVDLSGQDQLIAHLQDFKIGVLEIGAVATGIVSLPQDNHVDADTIVVGQGGQGTLNLGQTNVILTDELVVADGFSISTLDIPSGGTLDLGSSERRTSISVADQAHNSNSSRNGRIDLSQSHFDAFLNELIVGRKFGGPGTTIGEFIGGSSGDIVVGVGDNTSNIIVGQSVAGGFANGTIDFSRQDSFTANINQLLIGQSFVGAGTGTVKLADNNVLDANTIVVGDDGHATLELGTTNTILTGEIVIARGDSNSSLEVPTGATLEIGTPEQRSNLFVGQIEQNCNCTRSGEFDLSGATVTAYLDQVFIGEKNNLPGTGVGTLTIGNDSANLVDANSITIGIEKGIGNLNLRGGSLTAGVIEKGTGTANISWTGGTMHVDRFGSQQIRIDLDNSGSGTLAPGQSPGKTEVFGNYDQGPNATLEIELAGTQPVSQHDLLVVQGALNAAGTLAVKLIDNGSGLFRPEASDTFDILDFDTLSGQFDQITLPQLTPGLQWNTDALLSTGQISVEVIPGFEPPEGTLLVVAPNDTDNQLTLRRNGSEVEVVNAGSNVLASLELSELRQVQILGGGQDDQLTVDFDFGGFFRVAEGVFFDGNGGSGFDELLIVGNGTEHANYTPSGNRTGDGLIDVTGGSHLTAIHFAGLEPVHIGSVAGVTLTTPGNRDTVAISSAEVNGDVEVTLGGQSGGLDFESLTTRDVQHLHLDLGVHDQTGADQDQVSLAAQIDLSRLMTLTVDSGAGDDSLDTGDNLLSLQETLRFDSGTLRLAGGNITADLDVAGGHIRGFGTVDAAVLNLSDVAAEGGGLLLGDGTADAVTIGGTLDAGDQTVTLRAADFVELGRMTRLDAGQILATGGLLLGPGDGLVGNGAVKGRVAGELGSEITATGDLELGDENEFDGFLSGGTLNTNQHSVTIQDRDQGVLGAATEIGNAAAGGTLDSANGLVLRQTGTLHGHGLVHGDFQNEGNVVGEGPTPQDVLEFTGLVTGNGDFDGEIRFSGTFSPGNSPGRVEFGNDVEFTDQSTFQVELGGLENHEFDRVRVDGEIELGGTLEVNPVDLGNGYEFQVLDRFRVLEFTSAVGEFDQVQADVAPGLVMEVVLTDDFLDLVVIPTSWQNGANPLDINRDGHVVPNDALLLINDLNSNGPRKLPPISSQTPETLPPPYFDANGDNHTAPNDLLLVINFINDNSGGEGDFAQPDSSPERVSGLSGLLLDSRPTSGRATPVSGGEVDVYTLALQDDESSFGPAPSRWVPLAPNSSNSPSESGLGAKVDSDPSEPRDLQSLIDLLARTGQARW